MANPVRPCIACGQRDDHPKHIVVLRDGSEAPMHMDCCALARECEVCVEQTRNQGKARGEKFRAILTSQDGE